MDVDIDQRLDECKARLLEYYERSGHTITEILAAIRDHDSLARGAYLFGARQAIAVLDPDIIEKSFQQLEDRLSDPRVNDAVRERLNDVDPGPVKDALGRALDGGEWVAGAGDQL